MVRRIPLTKLVEARLPELDDVLRAIAAGEIQVDGVIVTNARANVGADASIVFTPRRALKGEKKLGAALDAFETPVALEGRVALDVGASTGGFTTELLRRGCRRVYAVDVGHGQLRGTLRQDHRVVNLEATNAADLSVELIPHEIDVATVDVSYTPLAMIVPQVTERVRFANDAALLALVKPMFELQLGQLPDRDEQLDEAVLLATDGIAAAGWTIEEVITSPVTGNQGAIEQWVARGSRDELDRGRRRMGPQGGRLRLSPRSADVARVRHLARRLWCRGRHALARRRVWAGVRPPDRSRPRGDGLGDRRVTPIDHRRTGPDSRWRHTRRRHVRPALARRVVRRRHELPRHLGWL